MSRHAATRLAWSIVGVAVVVMSVGLTVGSVGGGLVPEDIPIAVAVVAIVLTCAIVGALVASRHPSNPIGWILCGLAVLTGLSLGGEGYVEYHLEHGGGVRWLVQAGAWVGNWSYVLFFVVVTLVLLLFPDGHLPSRRWAPALWTCIVGNALFAFGVATEPGPLHEYAGVVNPAGLDVRVSDVVEPIAWGLTLVAVIAAVASVVIRFRRSVGVEREQIKWLAAASVIAAAGILVGGTIAGLGAEAIGNAIIVFGMLCIPLSIGVAMLRNRLYDVDRVISRTLVYGSLSLALAATYAGLVLVAQAVFSSFAGGSNLAIAVSTLVVAALFLPLRARIQRVVDRRFYRRRYDAQRTLEAFGARLRERVELESLSTELCGVVTETMQPSHITIWNREPTR